MKKAKIVMAIAGILIVVLLVVWSLLGYMSTSDIETPEYEVVQRARGYEVRQYAPQIRAEVTVAGGYRESLYGGFRKLADYIFGNNTAQTGIAMTAPVLSEQSRKIAMTAPVLHAHQEAGGEHVIAFIMPSEYTLETLPKPNNDEVVLREMPPRVYAVRRFMGYATERKAARHGRRLQELLEQDGLTAVGAPVVAQYNPPWTPPYMRRNEIMVPVER